VNPVKTPLDYFSQDSAHVTNGFSLNGPAASTDEDRIIHRRWAKAVLALYACLILAGATAWCPQDYDYVRRYRTTRHLAHRHSIDPLRFEAFTSVAVIMSAPSAARI